MGHNKNKIQIDLKKLPTSCRDLLDHTLDLAKKNRFIIELRDTDFVYCDEKNKSIPVEGFIEDDKQVRRIVVAAGRSLKKWFPVLTHESCHLDQLAEKAHAWTNTAYKGHDASLLIDDWVEHRKNLSSTDVTSCVKRIQSCEHDCELRTLQKFEDYDLPFDPEVYAKQANAYVWFYTFVQKERKWHSPGDTPVYLKPNVFELMPSNMMKLTEYRKMAPAVFSAYKENL